MKKIGDSFKGIGAGILMIILGVGLLWWNEGNNVKNLKTTAELENNYIDVKSDTIDSKNDGKLVAVSGKLINEKELFDGKFDITIKTPLMIRSVEVYQWVEKSEADDNDKTNYTYEKKWSNDLIDSSEFHQTGHDNPSQKLYEDEIYVSNDVKVGAFSLTDDQVKRLTTNGSYTDFNQEKITDLGLKTSGKYITNSDDLENPEVGDVRVSFDYNNSTEISVLAVQSGKSFATFTSAAGKKINKIMDGTHNGKDMIESIKSENNFLKWILRLAGALLCMIGFRAILSPISTITGFIPILGNIVGAAVGLVSIILGLCLSFIVMAIAWISFRPIFGISLLAITIILIAFLIIRGKKTKNSTPQPGE